MKVAIIWWFNKANWVYPNWRDGLRAAIEIIAKKHQVDWYLGTDVEIPDKYDFILNWDNSTSGFIPQMNKLSGRKGLVLTTDLGMEIDALRNYDVIFPEARPVHNRLVAEGINSIKAFGTDTNFFKSRDSGKVYEAFYPATFSPWKRQNIFSDKYQDKGLLVGTIQPDGWDIFKYCVERNTPTMVGYFPVEEIRTLYDKSKKVHITGWEGSGRTVLEAMSMGLSVEVIPDNHKAMSYIEEYKSSGLSPREFVLKNYSEEIYANQLLKGMK